MLLVHVPPISITQDARLQLVKVRPFKWMKMKGGWVGDGERERDSRSEGIKQKKAGELEAAEDVRLLDIRSREEKGKIFYFFLMGTDEQKASRENWTEERFNVIIGDAHLSGSGVIMSNQ